MVKEEDDEDEEDEDEGDDEAGYRRSPTGLGLPALQNEQKGNTIKWCKDLNLKAKARIWSDCLACAMLARQR